MEDEVDLKLQLLVSSLHARLGRLPSEDEVVTFVFGDSATREAIWNSVEKEQQ